MKRLSIRIYVLLLTSCAFYAEAQDVYQFDRLTYGEDYVEYSMQFVPISENKTAVIFPSWIPTQNNGQLMLIYDENAKSFTNDSLYLADSVNIAVNGISGGFYDSFLDKIVLAHGSYFNDVDGRIRTINLESMESDTIFDFNHPGSNLFYQGAVLSDSNYAFIGYVEIGADVADYWFVKTAPNGDVIWEKFYGTSKADIGKCVCESNDGSLYLGGGSRGYGDHIGTEYENLLIKTDKDGNELWRKDWGEDGSESIVTLNCTHDGGVITVGSLSLWYEDQNSHYQQPAISKLDKDGNMVWEFTEPAPNYEGEAMMEFLVAQITDEGNVFVVGTGPSTDSARNQFSVPWIYAIDSNGNLLMKRSYENVIDTPNRAIAFDLIQTSDGGFLMGGTYFDENATTQGNHQDAFILKLDERGCEYEDCQPPLSVEEEPRSETDEFNARPNPFSNEIEFTTLGRPGTLTVYDVRGVMVKEFSIAEKRPNIGMNAETLASGVYIASFRDSGTGQTHVLRIVKH